MHGGVLAAGIGGALWFDIASRCSILVYEQFLLSVYLSRGLMIGPCWLGIRPLDVPHHSLVVVVTSSGEPSAKSFCLWCPSFGL